VKFRVEFVHRSGILIGIRKAFDTTIELKISEGKQIPQQLTHIYILVYRMEHSFSNMELSHSASDTSIPSISSTTDLLSIDTSNAADVLSDTESGPFSPSSDVDTLSSPSALLSLKPLPARVISATTSTKTNDDKSEEPVLPSEVNRNLKLYSKLKRSFTSFRLKKMDQNTLAPLEKKPQRSISTKLKRYWKKTREVFVGKAPEKLYDVPVSDIEPVKSLIIDLVYGFLMFGMPVFRVDIHTTHISSYYGMNCYLDATETGFVITFATGDNPYDTRFVRVNPVGVDLSKMCKLVDTAYDIGDNKVTIEQARARIKKTISSPSVFSNPLFTVTGNTICAAIAAILLVSAPWPDIVMSTLMGLWSGIILGFVPMIVPALNQILPMICAVGAGLIGVGVKALFAKYGMATSILYSFIAGVFLLLPGFSLTIAFYEIGQKQWRSGIARLMKALATAAQLAAGLTFAFYLEHVTQLPNIEWKTFNYPYWAQALLLPCMAATFIIDTRAPQYPTVLFFILANCYTSYMLTNLLTSALGRSDLGIFLGAFLMEFVSKLYGWVTNHPPFIVSAVVILFNVPGSKAVRGISGALSGDSVYSADMFSQMLSITMCLAMGMIVANAVIPLGHRNNIRITNRIWNKVKSTIYDIRRSPVNKV
jgi:uncharacterized membrane protein YjjP (DUF1212 family)